MPILGLKSFDKFQSYAELTELTDCVPEIVVRFVGEFLGIRNAAVPVVDETNDESFTNSFAGMAMGLCRFRQQPVRQHRRNRRIRFRFTGR